MMRERYRTKEAQEYRKLYATKQWKMLRERALLRDRYRCQRCGVNLKRGRTSPNAAVVHHINPHKGNLDLFFDLDNLQSICKREHDSAAQSEEALGYSKEIGNDGWPIDDNHPGNGRRDDGQQG